jgi:methyl-accepting chemotaxis protein
VRFGNFGLKSKIVISSISPLVLAIAVAALGMGSWYVAAGIYQEALDTQTALRNTDSVERAAVAMSAAMRAHKLTGEKGFLAIYDQESKIVDNGLEKLGKQVRGNAAQAGLLDEAEKALKTWRLKEAVPVKAEGNPGTDSGGRANTQPAVSNNRDTGPIKDFRSIVGRLKKSEQALFAEHLDKAAGWIRKAELFVYPGVFIVIVVGLFQSYAMGRQISNAVGRATALAEATAKGDLSSRLPVENSDEVGRLSIALNDMAEQLTDHTRRIQDGVNVISASASEISTTASQLGVSTSKTSSSVAETSTTVEEVKQAAEVSSQKAKSVSDQARQAVEISESGKHATEDTLERMNQIKKQMDSVGETVIRLSEHSAAIENIISVVQDLADQSNLLAVNASIEAARAGDQGKGFAVVAQEIKSLADQSRDATEQVGKILEETSKWVAAVVTAAEAGNRAVDAGVEQSIVAGESIQALAGSVEESAQAATIIRSTTEQQFAGVDQVASAMADIDDAMKENLAGTSQLEDAARKLGDLGEKLKDLVSRYQL